MTAETKRRFDLLFTLVLRREAECGSNLPLSMDASEAVIERIQFAARKRSGGDMGGLVRAIELAQTD